jgi:putative NADH-flavin reductase
MRKETTIAVLGGGGRTGKFLISKLMEQGYRPKVLIRNSKNFEFNNPQVEIVNGDATDPKAVDSLIKNARAVISTLSQRKDEPLVALAATRNILRAMAKHEVRRYILVGGLNIDTPYDEKSIQTTHATDWMKANFPLIHDDRQKAYRELVESTFDWTLVRVPLIDFTKAKNAVVVNLQDCKGTKITAGGIADFLVGQLADEQFYRQAPFISEDF